MTRLGTSAPGKLMLAGEYAVLDGALALVCAVGARAWVRWVEPVDGSPTPSGGSPDFPALPAEVVVARRCVEHALGTIDGALTVDVSELRQAGRKLGLGSSAAAAAATVLALLAAHDADLGSETVRRQALELALEGHRAVAPEGSGADVAASVLGGVVRFRNAAGSISAERMEWPEGLEASVAWTGKEARTSDFVRRVRALRETSPAAYDGALAPLATASEEMIAAFAAADGPRIVAATAAHHDAMRALGEAAGVPIVEDSLEAISAMARACGGASKPSGAGGGDVAIAFFSRRSDRERFEDACTRAGTTLIPLALGAAGARTEALVGNSPLGNET